MELEASGSGILHRKYWLTNGTDETDVTYATDEYR